MKNRRFEHKGSVMMSMDWNLKTCCTSSRLLRPCCVDRLTSLPDELLSRILSLLPTKDAAVTQVLSTKMRLAFSRITSVDLDDSPVSYCLENTNLVERFPLFESFCDNVLRKLSQSKEPLTRFRFRVGADKTAHFPSNSHNCYQACLPYVKPTRLNGWISYPLAHCGLRELDLSFYVRNSDKCKLPAGLFVCQSLEVLRLASNLEIGAEVPLIWLPNLKLLHLHSFVFTDDDFVTRLVSSCYSLEDLSITYCKWVNSDYLTISSHSLRRLILDIYKCDEEKNSDLVHIDTPNLQYLDYADNLSYRYSVSHMNALVEASIRIEIWLFEDETYTEEDSFRSQLSFLKGMSYVQHLSLLGSTPEIVNYAGELKDQLPVFRDLRTLELGALYNTTWDIVLLLILHCSPLLETLLFSKGLFADKYCKHVTPIPSRMQVSPCRRYLEQAAKEADGLITTGIIPSCFLTHLKRIEINCFFGSDRELNMVKFLLSKASVLKEFVICLSAEFDAPNINQFERTIKELPRAANSCSITVCLGEPVFISDYKKYTRQLI